MTVDHQGKFDRAVESLHEAALGRAHWRETSALIDDACGWKGAHLVIVDRHSRGRPEWLFDQFYYHGESREEQAREYVEDFYPRDERVPRIVRLPDRQLVRVTDLLTEQEVKSSAAYNDLLRRVEGQHGFNVRMDGPNGLDIVLGTADAVGTGGWNSVHVDTIARMLPHIRQFVRVRHALIRAEALGATVTGLLDNMNIGVIYLDRRGMILLANSRARTVLGQAMGLSDRDGALRACVAADETKLGKLLADALPGRGRPPVSGSMTVERPLPLPRLVLHVNPLVVRQLDFGARSAAALVLLVDPAARLAIDADLVAATFHLTRGEAQVAAALAEGSTVHEIAAARYRAESSVRWLVKQIYTKLGISRQADLVRLVLTAAHGVPSRIGKR